MSEEGEQVEVQEVAEAQAYDNIADNLKIVLKKALIFDGLRRGLHESVKFLDSGLGKLCVLSNNCDNAEYTGLVKALCTEREIPLIVVDDGKLLGEWVGLAKLNAEGNVRKAVRCSVAVVTDFGEETPSLKFVMDYVRSQH